MNKSSNPFKRASKCLSDTRVIIFDRVTYTYTANMRVWVYRVAYRTEYEKNAQLLFKDLCYRSSES